MPLVNSSRFLYSRTRPEPPVRYRRFFLRVYHQGELVGEEPILARDLTHAHYMGAYIAPTVARESVHPRDFDRSRVHWTVTDSRAPSPESKYAPSVSEQATRRD